ncbi:MAG: ABC-type multidrug transport system fused ATPase/permease subunit, partial [Maribacter sp.]
MLKIEHVSYAYDKGLVLENIDLTIQQG